ncbi:hypothetical protein F4778DRAFT_786983 [Xylariomycetidae sp. FL2044]|nr:hypothetical protein F4778DRAFT_786983 [Xylariomycetidae sp. FL2044]
MVETASLPLFRMPAELLLKISAYLSTVDLFSLRLTCHHIESSVFDAFCKEFFEERRVMVTFDSLNALVGITQSPRLAKLKRLTIGLEKFNSGNALPRFRDYWDPGTRTVRRRSSPLAGDGIDPYRLDTMAVEQNTLITSGKLQLMLGEVLQRLPQLDELSLRDTIMPRSSRARPDSDNLLVSYGAARILRDTGIDMTTTGSHLHRYDDQFVDTVFSNVLLAATRSQARIKRLIVDIKVSEVGLSSSAFALPNFLLPDVQPVLFSLESIELPVSFIQVVFGSYTNGSNGFLQWQRHQLFSFLGMAPNATRLRIESKQQGFVPEGIVGWLAGLQDDGAMTALAPGTPESMSMMPGGRHFHSLRDLELVNMATTSKALLEALSHMSSSLERLTLNKISVSVGKEDDELDNNPKSPNAWSAVFQTLSDTLKPRYVFLSTLQHKTERCSTRQKDGHEVAFARSPLGTQSHLPNKKISEWWASGNIEDMREFLRIVAENTFIICPWCKEARNNGYRSFEESLG